MVHTNMGSGCLTREAIYELRRRLIGKLQMATRGVPRSQRIEGLRAFVRDWCELESMGRLDQLVLLLQGGNPEVAVPEFFVVLARITEPVRSGSEPEALPNLSRSAVRPALQAAGGGANSWWAGNQQGDLFPAGLATQPV